MNETKIIKLQVRENIENEASKEVTPAIQANQSNPIYKNMLKFHHAKIGEKLSIKDLLR